MLRAAPGGVNAADRESAPIRLRSGIPACGWWRCCRRGGISNAAPVTARGPDGH